MMIDTREAVEMTTAVTEGGTPGLEAQRYVLESRPSISNLILTCLRPSVDNVTATEIAIVRAIEDETVP